MLCKRIIPCLDVKAGRVVKGVNFINLIDAGDPVEAAMAYEKMGADEIVFLDIAATLESRAMMFDTIKATAKKLFIPLTVGGGIRSMKDIYETLNAGADKISINSAAIENPGIIKESSRKYGNQCIVIAVDAKKNEKKGNWEVCSKGGTVNTGIDALYWCKRVEALGAGEILLTSIDNDGMKSGYDIELTSMISSAVNIPIIASGGAGKKEDFLQVFREGKADAALAASLFHFKTLDITELKEYLNRNKIPVRLIKEVNL